MSTEGINSVLKLKGLTAQEFRVLVHAAERCGNGLLWDQPASFAKACDLTVAEAMVDLEFAVDALDGVAVMALGYPAADGHPGEIKISFDWEKLAVRATPRLPR